MSIFDKIISREIPAEIIYEDVRVIAFKDINPVRPGHFLVAPKAHSTNFIDIIEEDFIYINRIANKLAKETILEMGVDGYTYKVNNGKSVGQEIFHTHIHIIPSLKK